METMTRQDRINKREFIREMAATMDVTLNAAEAAYDAFLGTVVSQTQQGRTVTLAGFGRFYRQIHAGHKVQFGGVTGKTNPYPLLKFSAAANANRALTDEVPAQTPINA